MAICPHRPPDTPISPSEFSTILAALGGDGEQHVTMKGNLGIPPSNEPLEEPQDELTTTEEEVIDDESEMPPEDEDLFGVSATESAVPANYSVEVEQLAEAQKALDDAIQAALTGTKSPEDALKEAQSLSERLLKQYR